MSHGLAELDLIDTQEAGNQQEAVLALDPAEVLKSVLEQVPAHVRSICDADVVARAVDHHLPEDFPQRRLVVDGISSGWDNMRDRTCITVAHDLLSAIRIALERPSDVVVTNGHSVAKPEAIAPKTPAELLLAKINATRDRLVENSDRGDEVLKAFSKIEQDFRSLGKGINSTAIAIIERKIKNAAEKFDSKGRKVRRVA